MTVSSRGVALAVAGLGLLLAGFGLGYRELVVLGCAALLAVACAVGYAAWRPELEVHRVARPDRVTRGESSTVTLTVHNGSRWRAATLIAYDRCGERRIPVPLLRLRPQRDTVVSFPVPTERRGVVPIGPLRVIRADPLGLVSVARTHGDRTQVWVHPRSHPLAAVPAGVTRSLDGRIDRVPHGSITFAALREYVVGDELRHVHWRTSAKVGELMVREHTDTSLPRLVLVLDDRAASWPGAQPPEAFEAACEAAASVIAAAVREDLPVALLLVGAQRPTPSGVRQDAGFARDLLDRLAEASPSTVSSPAPTHPPDQDALTRTTALLRQRRVGDTLVYLTGGGGVGDLGLVAGLRGAYPAVVAAVFGTDAPVPSTVHSVLVLNAADGPEFAAAWDGVRSW